jgi:hypothetical protein
MTRERTRQKPATSSELDFFKTILPEGEVGCNMYLIRTYERVVELSNLRVIPSDWINQTSVNDDTLAFKG